MIELGEVAKVYADGLKAVNGIEMTVADEEIFGFPDPTVREI